MSLSSYNLSSLSRAFSISHRFSSSLWVRYGKIPIQINNIIIYNTNKYTNLLDVGDVERYDTTVTIPTNLKDGTYIMQWASLVGNIKEPYFSCAKLTVTGGNPNMKCQSTNPPVTYTCERSGGPPRSQITVCSLLYADYLKH